MPLIRPEIQKVLRAVGLEKEESPGTASEKLTAAGLSQDRIAEELTEIATSSGNEALKLKALETALRVHGALKDQTQVAIPSFTVIIQSASGETISSDVNPILIPRQSLNKEGSPFGTSERADKIN